MWRHIVKVFSKYYLPPLSGAAALLCSTSVVQAAASLDTWATRVLDSAPRDVVYGAGLFVTTTEAIQTSPDSECWTQRILERNFDDLRGGVTYGKGMFVAVGYGSAYVSTNGTSWLRSADLSRTIHRVAFGEDTFVAVGQNVLATSTNGVDWKTHTLTNIEDNIFLTAAAFGNGRCVLSGYYFGPGEQTNGGLFLVSTNLSDWATVKTAAASCLNGITYGLETFVAVGPGILTSSDGLQWTNRLTVGIPSQLKGAGFGDDTFVVVGLQGSVLSSTNAIDWTTHPITNFPSFTEYEGVTYGNGSFVIVGAVNTAVTRGVALQSGGRPQLCLKWIGPSPPFDPRISLWIYAELNHNYRLQSSPVMPPVWTTVTNYNPGGGYPERFRITDPNPPTGPARFYRVVSP